jgi:hypothetical protein
MGVYVQTVVFLAVIEDEKMVTTSIYNFAESKKLERFGKQSFGDNKEKRIRSL